MDINYLLKKHEIRLLLGKNYTLPKEYDGVRSYDAVCEFLQAHRRSGIPVKAIVFSHLDALTDVWLDVETGEKYDAV